jgi:hypothetical protein
MTVHTLADLTFALGHKIGLEALPLHGSKSAVAPYIPARAEEQEYLLGTSLHDFSDTPDDEGDHEESNSNCRVAA